MREWFVWYFKLLDFTGFLTVNCDEWKSVCVTLYRLVGSQTYGCLATCFCYQWMAKPGNMTAICTSMTSPTYCINQTISYPQKALRHHYTQTLSLDHPALIQNSKALTITVLFNTYSTSHELSTWFVMFYCNWVLIDITYILQGYSTRTGAIMRLPQCQRSNLEEYG